jgi:hypothetical protein
LGNNAITNERTTPHVQHIVLGINSKKIYPPKSSNTNGRIELEVLLGHLMIHNKHQMQQQNLNKKYMNS